MAGFFSRLFLFPIIRLFIGKIEGVKNLPRKGPFIIASNHSSFIDDIFIYYAPYYFLRRKLFVFVNSRFYKSRLLTFFLNQHNCIPVDVKKDVIDDKKRKVTNDIAIDKALECLKRGNIFGVFPEGGRSKDGKLKKAKNGIAKITLLSKVLVIPIGFKGSYDIMQKGSKFPKIGKKADIIIGKPMTFEDYYGKENELSALEEISRKIMKEIAKLINEEYDY